VDLVATSENGFVVQGLVDVADEVDEELKCLILIVRAGIRVE